MARPCCLECVRALPDDAPCPTCGRQPESLEIDAEGERHAIDIYNALREWTRRQGRIQGGDAYMVLPKATVARVALVQPTQRESLRRVKGLGPVKDRDYGTLLVRWLTTARTEGAEKAGPVPLARAPMPPGLSQEEEDAVNALREAAAPLGEVFAGRDALDAVAALVEKGATDLVRVLVSPFDLSLVARHLENHPTATAESIARALPGVSAAAARLVPLVASEPVED